MFEGHALGLAALLFLDIDQLDLWAISLEAG
jgi:hypothetical protein